MATGNLHEDFGPTLWVGNTIFIALATVAVMARFAARRLRKLRFGADDWLICLALFWDWVLYGLFVGCAYSTNCMYTMRVLTRTIFPLQAESMASESTEQLSRRRKSPSSPSSSTSSRSSTCWLPRR